MTDLVYIDCETTGLDPEIHEVWELAYAVNDGPIQHFGLPHSNITADLKALEMNGYYERGGMQSMPYADLNIRKVLTGNTLVCANPEFDVSFLRKRWGVAPWHYRKIDIESVALGILGYDRPKGLKGITEDLIGFGYPIPTPDHSAAGDVHTMREAYLALKMIQRKYLAFHNTHPTAK